MAIRPRGHDVALIVIISKTEKTGFFLFAHIQYVNESKWHQNLRGIIALLNGLRNPSYLRIR
jgi:hypothetical protein